MPLNETAAKLVDDLAKAGATPEQVDQLRSAAHPTVRRAEQATEEFAAHSEHLRTQFDRALEAERTHLAAEAEALRIAAETKLNGIAVAHAARKARIAQAQANARATRIGRIDADEERRMAAFQRDLLEANGLRDRDTGRNTSTHEAFRARLDRERTVLDRLEFEARPILEVFGVARGASGHAGAAAPTRHENELVGDLHHHLESAARHLKRIRELKLRRLFAFMPAWQWTILSFVAQLVLMPGLRGTELFVPSLPQAAAAALVSVAVVYGLYFLGRRLGAPTVAALAVALAEARTLHADCVTKADASFAAEDERIRAGHARTTHLLTDQLQQRQAEARSQRVQWAVRLEARARQLDSVADARRLCRLAETEQACARQGEQLTAQSAERRALLEAAHAGSLTQLTTIRDAALKECAAAWQEAVLPIYTALKAAAEAAKAVAWQEAKRRKLERLRPLLAGAPVAETATCLDFLSDELREKFSIIETNNVSAHGYDPNAQGIIESAPDGFVLDCGAGSRGDLLPNVVNFEIVNYPSTDVRGVAESLPFRDGVFDGVLCLNVLEHVKDPFQAAREIIRVMKPGARLYCVVPFLQPLHAYPHHYYNMTAAGLCNLFAGQLEIERQEVPASGLPVWTLTWFLGRWIDGLPPETKHQFALMRVGDLLGETVRFLEADFVKKLSPASNFELASTTALFARKAPVLT